MEIDAERLDREALIVGSRGGARQQPQGRDREMMGTLGIEPRDERVREPIAEPQHHGERSRSAGGKRCRPSVPSGIFSTKQTADKGSVP